GSGWKMELRLADAQHSVVVSVVHDTLSGYEGVDLSPFNGRYSYPGDIGYCGTGARLADNIDIGKPHTYDLNYSERAGGSGIIASVTASVDKGTPVTVDLQWTLTNPNALLLASSRDTGDTVQ